MSRKPFTPTTEQTRVIEHEGGAFVSACPGAGKTRVLVERARVLLQNKTPGKGVAFLSFTNAAVSALEHWLRHERLLVTPAFPHFIGTFDSFLWQFLVAPFGVSGCECLPRLIPDKDKITVCPFPRAQRLPLSCFDRKTGAVILEAARRCNFDPERNARLTRAYTSRAASIRRHSLERGEVDFEDVRTIAATRLRDRSCSVPLARALSARFKEVIVDEAQDCNPADLEIIQWLRSAGIWMKVVCDPNQSIYGFRGGVGDELLALGETFDQRDRLGMRGNFRSSGIICRAIAALRPAHARGDADQALGKQAAITTPVCILAYRGKGVPFTVGLRFRDLVEAEGIDAASCPVLASTWSSAANAVGQPCEAGRQDLTLRLAAAVSRFYLDFDTGSRRAALEEVHRVVLEIEGEVGTRTYHQYVAESGLGPDAWRPRMLHLVRQLRYDPAVFRDADAWLGRARALLEQDLPEDGRSIAQRLPRNAGLCVALSTPPASGPPARSIHSVKGREFPAVCVVMTVPKTSGILDYLETGGASDWSEDARKIYVAASRAQRLLAIATPRGQAERLARLLGGTGAAVSVVYL